MLFSIFHFTPVCLFPSRSFSSSYSFRVQDTVLYHFVFALCLPCAHFCASWICALDFQKLINHLSLLARESHVEDVAFCCSQFFILRRYVFSRHVAFPRRIVSEYKIPFPYHFVFALCTFSRSSCRCWRITGGIKLATERTPERRQQEGDQRRDGGGSVTRARPQECGRFSVRVKER